MRLPRIDFRSGGLDCPICHSHLPLPLSLSVLDRTCDCGVVARLLSKIAVHAQWGVGLDVQPREGYRSILPYRNVIGLEDYVIFEQPMAPVTIGRDHRRDVEHLRQEGRQVRDRLDQERRSRWQRPLGRGGRMRAPSKFAKRAG
jgi:hypothetical protein